MRFSGEIVSIHRDLASRNMIVSFAVTDGEKDIQVAVPSVHGKKLTVEVKPYRKKRSLNANNYAWKLMSEMADMQGTSKEEIYEIMLERYGSTLTEDDKAVLITVRAYVDMRKAEIHCAKVARGYIGGKEYISYRVIKGSSQYDTHEMGRFIDGIVSECREMGIDTLTPAEIQEIKERWGIEVDNPK